MDTWLEALAHALTLSYLHPSGASTAFEGLLGLPREDMECRELR